MAGGPSRAFWRAGAAPGPLACSAPCWPGPGRSWALTGPRAPRQARQAAGTPCAGRPAAGPWTAPGPAVTVVAAASSGVRAGRALPALVLGNSLFLRATVLGTPSARRRGLLEQARLPVLAAAAIFWPPPRPCSCAAADPRDPGPGRRRLPSLPGPRAGPRGTSPRKGWAPGRGADGRSCQVDGTSRQAGVAGVLERPRPDLSGQSRPLCPGDCWTCSTAGEPPLESGDLPELLNALVANSTTASPASTVATRMARQGRHPVRAVVTGSSGKRASFSRRP
jgi:hypothetical protein